MEIAGLPEGPLTTGEIDRLGLSRKRLRAAIVSRTVVRVLRGVYLGGDVELTTAVKLSAAALVIRPGSVACDRTAAWIWGVDVHAFRELDVVPPIETCVLPGCDPTDRREVRGMTRDLAPGDWVSIDGVRVTTPVRTALDLGCSLNRRSALAAMDALMRGHGFTIEDLRRQIPGYFRRRGVLQLRGLVPLVDSQAEPQPESWTRLEMLDHGLPQPELQWWICIDGVPTYRLDRPGQDVLRGRRHRGLDRGDQERPRGGCEATYAALPEAVAYPKAHVNGPGGPAQRGGRPNSTGPRAHVNGAARLLNARGGGGGRPP